MPPPARSIHLEDALELPGCPVCRMVLQRVEQTVETLERELVLDPAWREQVDSAWGFCTVHAQLWLERAQPLSTAIIYEAVLGRISTSMERAARGKGQLRGRLPGIGARGRECEALVESGVCPLCRARDEQERQVVAHLVRELDGSAMRERYQRSDGLCVAHLNLALSAGPSAAALDALRTRLATTHELLRAHLREVIRKHDYRNQDEIAGPEWAAIEQTVRHVAGRPGIDGRRGRIS